jgi:hypothetical protein
LVDLGNGGEEENGGHLLKALNPLAALRTLTAHIQESAQVKKELHYACMIHDECM